MTFTNLPLWLRAGIITDVLYIIFTLGVFIYTETCKKFLCNLWMAVPLYPAFILLGKSVESIHILLIVNLILFFLIGAIIGSIRSILL